MTEAPVIGCATFDAMALLVAVLGLLPSVLAERELALVGHQPLEAAVLRLELLQPSCSDTLKSSH